MLTTGPQLRAGRAAAALTREELAAAAGISRATVQRLEGAPGRWPAVTDVTRDSLEKALERRGVTFGEENGAVVVKLAIPPPPR